jgi:hypothetical protein
MQAQVDGLRLHCLISPVTLNVPVARHLPPPDAELAVKTNNGARKPVLHSFIIKCFQLELVRMNAMAYLCNNLVCGPRVSVVPIDAANTMNTRVNVKLSTVI